MRAVVVEEQGQVRVVDDVPMPVPGEYDALVKIVACGFCNGTDMRIIHGQMTRQQGLQPYPTVLGPRGRRHHRARGQKGAQPAGWRKAHPRPRRRTQAAVTPPPTAKWPNTA